MKTPQALNRFARPRSLQVLILVLVLLALMFGFAGWRDPAGPVRWGGKAVLAAQAHPASPVREAIARKLKTQAKVNVELFVMSQCPFGVRAEEAMAPVLEEFGAQVEFQLRFIASPTSGGFASLHGQPEVDEDIRQVIMAKQYPQQYFDYVVARAANYRSNEWQAVAAASGMDVKTVERLARSEYAKRLFAENIRRGNELRIGASPTILLDGEKYQGRILPPAPAAATAKTAGAAASSAKQPAGAWSISGWQKWFTDLGTQAQAAVQAGFGSLAQTSAQLVDNSRALFAGSSLVAGATGQSVPAITATKSATLPNTGCPGNGTFDLNCNGLVNPGDKLMYSVLLNNTGTDALNVVFTDVLNAHLTFAPGSLDATPIARNDSYTTAFNRQLEVAAVQTVPGAVFVNGSVRANDIDPLGGTLPVTPLNNVATAQGGVVSLSNTGTFLYTPANNFSGADSFSYTVTRSPGKTDTAQVTITVNSPVCGDGLKQGAEICDDGDNENGDGCSASCTVESGFSCTGATPSVCMAICGDGLKVGAETCDDGNLITGDGCSASCVVEGGYSCTGSAPSVCTTTCGDGLKAGAESCDDGDSESGDGCSATCTVESGFNCVGSAPSVCNGICGDGLKRGSEQCDDGNTASGDGCSATCQYEAMTETEPNNTAPTASGPFDIPTHAFGKLLSGAVNPASDVDYYSFSIPAHADLQFQTFDAAGPGSCAPPTDTLIELFAPNGTTVLASNDNFGTGACSQLAAQRLAPGTYYLKVSSPNPLITFNYTVQARYLALCGNGMKEGSEECDGGAGCDASCERIPNCGDNFIDAPETCDDGNTVSGGGCSAACQLETCSVGHANCDGNSANGCEVDLRNDVGNCGSCGNNCAAGAVNSNWACVTSVCQFQGCQPGYYDLNGDQQCEYACNFTSATEVCNGVDDNCNGQIDENVTLGQTPGDCRTNVCSGGGVTPVPDNTDLPVDGNQCTADVCTNGVPSNPPLSPGETCNQGGGSVCDGAGACVQCVTASQCPGQDTECQVRTCNAGTCGFNFTSAGTPVAAQAPGDCKRNQCDGAGGIVTVNDDTDLPNDNNACTLDTCSNGIPAHTPVNCDGVQSGTNSGGGYFAQARQWLRMILAAFSNSLSYVKLEGAFSPAVAAASLPVAAGNSTAAPLPAQTLLINSNGASAIVPTAALPKSFNGETITVNGGGSGFTLPAGRSTTITFNVTISSGFTGTAIQNQASVAGTNFATVNSNNLTTQVFQSPAISSNTVPVKAGSSAASFTIATAFDPDQAANTLGITINGNPTTASSNGVTISNLAISPSGAVTANITTTCAATSAIFNLVVTDSQSAQGVGTLTVTVTPNMPPMLSYNPTTVITGTTPLINPASGPSDNGTITGLVLQNITPNNGGLAVSVNAASGQVQVLSATLMGIYTVNLAVTDHCNATAIVPLTVNVGCPTLTFNPATLPNGVQGTAYNQTLTASPAGGNYSYTLTAGALPPGLTLTSNGTLNGMPTAGGNYNFSVKATGWGGCQSTRSYTLLVTGTCTTITLDPATLVGATVGAAYHQTFTATPTGTYGFAVTQGALPPGLTLAANTGALTGTPTAGGTFSFRVTATGAGGCTGSRSYVVSVGCGTLMFTPASLPGGMRGVAYSQQLSVGANSNATFSLLLGSLPPGFTLSSTGLLSGTTNQTGTYNFTIKALAGTCQGTKAYALVIGAGTAALAMSGDYDGDGQSDLTLWSARAGVWRINQSSNNQAVNQSWGTAGDVTLLGDYDGDGKSDLAVFRPSEATFYIKRSSDGQAFVKQWGLATDVPVPGDYDGDGQTDLAVWRGATGTWYIVRSSDGQFDVQTWGAGYAPYSDVPVPGDYDGDGKTDPAVFRRGNGTWLIKRSTDGKYTVKAWGLGTDTLVPQDYDGDGLTDIAVWRSGLWYIWQSVTSNARVTEWGTTGDQAVAGDYDGDGKADLAVWRVPEGRWYIQGSSKGSFLIQDQGQQGDLALPANGVR